MIDSKRSSRRRIIVSADDFGSSPRANRNALYLISLGKINRVGIMVNGEISPKELNELIRSGVKIDIHFNISNKPVSNNKIAVLRIINFLLSYLFGKTSTDEIQTDWENQIGKFRSLFGKNPDGISSYEHIHFFPPFFKVAVELQSKYGIPFMRFGDGNSLHHNNLTSHILHYLRKINMRTCLESACVSSGSFVSIGWIKNFDDFLDNLPEGTIEVSCHPGCAKDFVEIKKYF